MDVSSLTAKFLAGDRVTCDDPEQLAPAIWDLNNRLDEKMEERDFWGSLRALRAIDTARGHLIVCLKKRNQLAVQQAVHERQATNQRAYEDFCEAIRQQQEALEEQIQQQIQQLRDQHEHEYAKHDAAWGVEPKQRQFNRSSQKLRILRIQQQLLMNARRFDEAAQVCGIADRLAVAETASSGRQMLTEFDASKTLLEKRQANEMDTLLKACEVRRGELRHTRERLARRFENRTVALGAEEDTAKDPDALWARGHRTDGDQIVAICGGPRKRPAPIFRGADVAEFNTLPLPALPTSRSARKNRARDHGLRRTT
jgi:hypothetical protein